jgi:hypothetical protein
MFTPFAFVKPATTAGPAFTGILDDYPSAAGAWSAARRLSGTYTGNILTVRRASDNTTQNIGYTSNGDLDVSAINTFCSGTNGFVTTLYDQSGNGVNLVQGTSTRQPLIYTGSTGIITKGPNSEPSMLFDGTNDNLSGSYAASTDTYMSVFAVAAPANITGDYFIYAQSTSKTTGLPAFGICTDANSNFKDFMWGAGQEAIYNPSTTNLATLAAIRRAASPQNKVWLNGTAGATTTAATDLTLGTNISLGCIFVDDNGGAGTFPFSGSISELIVWRSDQTSNVSGIDSNMGTYYGV